MALVKVGSLAKLPPGTVMEATVGEERFAVCNVGGQIHALSGTCPHRGGPLGQGAVNEGALTCPWHAWEFDCRTGVNDYNPAVTIPTYPAQVSGDEIWIDVP